MDGAFIYDKYVSGKNFIGRKGNAMLVQNLLLQGEHIVMWEPPKTGKTSLIQQSLFNMRMSGNRFTAAQFSIIDIRSIESFMERLGSSLLRMVGATAEEYASMVEKYLPGTHFVFDMDRFSQSDKLISFSWDLDDNDFEAMLNLPWELARDRGERCVVIIDEFQNLDNLPGGEKLMRQIARVMQSHIDSGSREASYVLCGSQVNAMNDIFSRRHIFVRLVERVKLSEVDEKEVAEHIIRGFLSGGKVIDRDLLIGACRLFKGHLWYINHFSAICDAKSKGYIMEPILLETLECLMALHEPRFRSAMYSLTLHQISLLEAAVDGVQRFSAADVIRKYDLHSSANVSRVKEALAKKEILTFDANDNPHFIDPLMEYWLKKYYFAK